MRYELGHHTVIHLIEDTSPIKDASNLKPPFPTASYEKGKAPLTKTLP